MSQIPQNNTNFPTDIANKLHQYKIDGDPKDFPIPSSDTVKLSSYQKVLSDYISDDTNYRGLLIYHGLGSGKTLTSISIAEGIDKEVIVLLPASLKKNFIGDLQKHIKKYKLPNDYDTESKHDQKIMMKDSMNKINKKYTFVSSNAWNAASTMESLDEKESVLKLIDDEIFDHGVFQTKNALDNKLLIVDEAHNLCVNIINPKSINGIKIYEQIMDANNLNLIFLTGTPLVKDPYELGIMFNMLRGYITIPGDSDKYTAFPSDYTEFNKYFIDRDTNKIMNENIFKERIVGLVSYYSGLLEDASREIFPEKKPTILEYVPMSAHQWKQYVIYRREEIEMERISKHKKQDIVKAAFKKPSKSSQATYRIRSRQISNFALPENTHFPKVRKDINMEEVYHHLIDNFTTSQVTDGLKSLSPKMNRLLQNIQRFDKGIQLVYSDFKNIGGVNLFARILEENGFDNYNKMVTLEGKIERAAAKEIKNQKGGKNNKSDKNKKSNKSDKNKKSDKSNKSNKINKSKKSNNNGSFAIFSGDTSHELRSQILKVTNADNNMYGEHIRVLMITGAGAEGLDLKNIRKVHIMEPYWNNSRIQQVIGRAVRIRSHIALPYKERTVDTYMYMSVPIGGDQSLNAKILDKDEKLTTDVTIYENAKRRQYLLNQFLIAIREMAMDCVINYDANKKMIRECTVCIPDNKIMYYDNIRIHMLPNNSNCRISKQKELTAFEDIKIKGKSYKYDPVKKRVYHIIQKSGKDVYQYSSKLTEEYKSINE
jgi:superfamily II DNA or RNA helicase